MSGQELALSAFHALPEETRQGIFSGGRVWEGRSQSLVNQMFVNAPPINFD